MSNRIHKIQECTFIKENDPLTKYKKFIKMSRHVILNRLFFTIRVLIIFLRDRLFIIKKKKHSLQKRFSFQIILIE